VFLAAKSLSDQQVAFVFALLEAKVFQLLHIMALRVLATPEEVVTALHSASYPGNQVFKAFYDSRLNAVITDPVLMTVPIDDHMVHRAHSVFDTLLVVDGKAYLLEQHLDRFLKSAAAAKVDLPMTREAIKSTIKQLVAITGLRSCRLRFWLSAGPGSLYILPVPGMSVFYALVYDDGTDPRTLMLAKTGAKEFTVDLPLKPQFLATMKTTNYLLNAHCAMQAVQQGGRLGIQKDPEGFITECAVANVSFVLPGKRFVTPPFQSILAGTVISRLLLLAQGLLASGVIASIDQRPIHIDEAKTAVEVIQSGGDSLSPVVEWDGVAINEGQIGPVYIELRRLYLEEMYGSDPILREAIEYS